MDDSWVRMEEKKKSRWWARALAGTFTRRRPDELQPAVRPARRRYCIGNERRAPAAGQGVRLRQRRLAGAALSSTTAASGQRRIVDVWTASKFQSHRVLSASCGIVCIVSLVVDVALTSAAIYTEMAG
jgi:hypothetical protein